MKKKILLGLTAFLSSAVILISCIKEPDSGNHENDDSKFSVEDAKAFFEEYSVGFQVVPFTKNPARTRSGEIDVLSKIQKEPLIPLWDDAKSFTKDGITMVEVPLNLPAYRNIRSDEANMSLGAGSPMGNHVRSLVNSTSRLLVTCDEINGIEFMMVTIISAEFHQIKTRTGDIKLSLSDMNNFSGRVVYRNMDGSFLKGDIYSKGKIVGITYPLEEDRTNEIDRMAAQTRGWIYYENCITTTITTTFCEYRTVTRGEDVVILGPYCYNEIEQWENCWISQEWDGIPDPPKLEVTLALSPSSVNFMHEYTVSLSVSNLGTLSVKSVTIFRKDKSTGTKVYILKEDKPITDARFNASSLKDCDFEITAEVLFSNDKKVTTAPSILTMIAPPPVAAEIITVINKIGDGLLNTAKTENRIVRGDNYGTNGGRVQSTVVDDKRIYSIGVSSSILGKSDTVRNVVIAHELYHIYKAENSKSFDESRDHQAMPTDPVYLSWIKSLVTGMDNDFYKYAVYIGTGATVQANLSLEEHKKLNEFYKKYFPFLITDV